mgnify:CR=1 FL=1
MDSTNSKIKKTTGIIYSVAIIISLCLIAALIFHKGVIAMLLFIALCIYAYIFNDKSKLIIKDLREDKSKSTYAKSFLLHASPYALGVILGFIVYFLQS